MSFEPFDFKFNPPPTVSTPSLSKSTVTPTNASPGTVGSQSNAGQLITKLDELTAMSKYLQDAIVARTRTLAVQVDSSVDPETGRALAHIYGTPTPNFISVSMYDKLLDAHLGALQMEMAIPDGAPIQPNPLQVADLSTVVNTVDNHLLNNPSYKNWLPLQLASLKGDSIIFQNWKQSLQSYPAYFVPQPLIPNSARLSALQVANLDVSMDLYLYADNSLNHFGQSYTSTYQAMAGVHAVERDINSILNQYFYQPLENILRIIALFNALVGFSHITSMANLLGDLTNFSFIRLAAETTGMLYMCDQLMAMAAAPLSGTLGSLGRIVAGAQAQAAELGFLLGGGLSGMSKANACAQGNPYNKIKGGKPLNIPGLGQISEGLKQMAETLNWGSREAAHQLDILDKSFRQILERRMGHMDDQSQLMCSIRALDTLIGVANGVAAEFQKGTVTQNPNQQQAQEASARILTSLQTGSDTTFTVSGGDIIVNPPDMPAPSEPVQNVLRRAKVKTTIGPIIS